jgi:hypothetical protein
MSQPGRVCACGCGTPVSDTATWVRGHVARGRGGYQGPTLLPPPDDPAYDDIGELEPDEPAIPVSNGDAPPAPSPGPPLEDAGPVPPDPEPAHAKRGWKRQQDRSKPKPSRITAGIRGDIDAKVRFALQVPGAIWQARDPLCGGTFVEQIPDTAEAFTDIICDSADLVAFFTGPGGNFMKALKVGAALMPVAQVVMAHHVYHSVSEVRFEPDTTRYAA